MNSVLPAGAAPAPGLQTPAQPPERSFGAVLEGLSLRGPPRGGEQHLPPAAAAPPGRPYATVPARLLESVDRARARLEGVLAAARSGRTFTAQELLGLQAEAYRTVQTVDLAVKLAEQGAQSVRQALGTQV
jgi:hypothetical protein